MKTDLEKFIELYQSVGIEPDRFDNEDGSTGLTLFAGEDEKDSDKLDGYIGFHTEISFDTDGKFIKQGFWE